MVWQLLCIYLVWNTKSNNIWIITGAINPSIVGNPLYLCRIHLWRAQCIFINLLLFLIKIFTIWGQKERSITIHIGHLATAEGPAKEVNLRMGLGWYIISEAFSGPSTSSYPSSAPTSPVSPGPLVIWWQHSQPLSQGCSFIRQSSWFSHFRHFRHCPVWSIIILASKNYSSKLAQHIGGVSSCLYGVTSEICTSPPPPPPPQLQLGTDSGFLTLNINSFALRDYLQKCYIKMQISYVKGVTH